MKSAILITLIFVSSALPLIGSAHDPKEHHKHEAAAPDCSKMKNMDASKMDMNDPVMKALHAKCEKQMQHDMAEHEQVASEQPAAASPTGASAIDCSKMKGMDMSKMDMNSPAVKAMHEKCSKKMHQPSKPAAAH